MKRDYVKPVTSALLLLLLLLLYTNVAFAQAAGAGGGSFLQGLLNYIENNVVQTIAVLAIMGIGLILLSGRFALLMLVGVAAGIYIIANAQNLYAYIVQ